MIFSRLRFVSSNILPVMPFIVVSVIYLFLRLWNVPLFVWRGFSISSLRALHAGEWRKCLHCQDVINVLKCFAESFKGVMPYFRIVQNVGRQERQGIGRAWRAGNCPHWNRTQAYVVRIDPVWYLFFQISHRDAPKFGIWRPRLHGASASFMVHQHWKQPGMGLQFIQPVM